MVPPSNNKCDHYVKPVGGSITIKVCDPCPTYYIKCSGCGWPLTVEVP